jgi:hypothetical protein
MLSSTDIKLLIELIENTQDLHCIKTISLLLVKDLQDKYEETKTQQQYFNALNPPAVID